MPNFYCEYCGRSASSVQSLTAGYCHQHPSGPGMGKHKLYEGSEKDVYTCKYCGRSNRDLRTLTAGFCHRHPNGVNKGKHSPAL